MATEARSRVLLDPSVLFRDEALGWLENQEIRPYLAVSSSLVKHLSNPESLPRFARFGPIPTHGRAREVRERLDGIYAFSRDNAKGISPKGGAIRDSLLKTKEPMVDVLADEWVFLISESSGIWDTVGRVKGSFEKAGATVYEFTRAQLVGAQQAVRKALPRPVLDVLKVVAIPALPGPNIVLVIGGGVAVALVPALAIPAIAVGVLIDGSALIAGDP